MVDPPPPLPEGWDRCRAYMEQKRRYCRQIPKDGQAYCGNHQHFSLEQQSRIRVPCPLDPSHSIFQDMLEKHIQICPQGKKRKRLREEPYYSENVNAGGFGDLGSNNDDSVSVNRSQAAKKEWAHRLALRVLQVHQSIFTKQSLQKDNVNDLTWEEIHDALPMQDLSGPELDGGIQHGFHSHHIKSGGARNIPQLASLIGHLRSMKVLDEDAKKQRGDESTEESTMATATTQNEQSRPLILIEMGAGRGMFGLAAAGVAMAGAERNSKNVHLIMVERTGSRSKAEKAFRNIPKDADTSYLNLQHVKWSRCACDLSHVNLPTLLQSDEFKDAKVVVVAKHLCGAGTDLALKSMASISDKVDACLFATCCHGICDWKHYVGRDYLRDIMEEGYDPAMSTSTDTKPHFGAAEFDLLRKWCAASVSTGHDDDAPTAESTKRWDVDKTHNEDEEAEHSKCLSPECEKVVAKEGDGSINVASVVRDLGLSCGISGLGRACKQLIDFGRSEYLRNQVFQDKDANHTTSIAHYVPPMVSPENTVMSAGKSGRA